MSTSLRWCTLVFLSSPMFCLSVSAIIIVRLVFVAGWFLSLTCWLTGLVVLSSLLHCWAFRSRFTQDEDVDGREGTWLSHQCRCELLRCTFLLYYWARVSAGSINFPSCSLLHIFWLFLVSPCSHLISYFRQPSLSRSVPLSCFLSLSS